MIKHLHKRIETLERKQRPNQPTKTLGDFYRLCKIPGTDEYKALNRLYDSTRDETEKN